ncbi:MAG TPA: hypothetical protein VIM65_18505 [Cyclobacteriaceae bacterium]
MRTFLFFSLLLIGTGVYAQISIEYVFNKNTDREVKKFLAIQVKNDSMNRFYFILSRETTDCNNYKLYIGIYKDAPLGFVNDIIKASSRFYRFDRTQIPICFDYDFDFIGYGEGKRGITRKNLVGDFFYVEFSRNDKILKAGY